MKPGTSAGRIPANVSVSARATVTAGLANDVDAGVDLARSGRAECRSHSPSRYVANADLVLSQQRENP
jgi:hypothetical protein